MDFRKVALVAILFVFSWGTQGAFTVRNYSKAFSPWQACQLLLGGAMTSSVRSRFFNEKTTETERVAIFQTLSHRAQVNLLADLVLPLPDHIPPKSGLTWIGHLLQVLVPRDPLEQNVVIVATDYLLDVARGTPPNSDYVYPISPSLRAFALAVLEQAVEFENVSDVQYRKILSALSEVLFGTHESMPAPNVVKEKAVQLLHAITRDTTAPRDVHRVAYGFLEQIDSISLDQISEL